MNVERLNDLLNVLLEVKKENLAFNMWEWANECLTVACAAGWYIIKRKPADLFLIRNEMTGGYTLGNERNSPSYPANFGYEFLAEHFGVSGWLACFIFSPDKYELQDSIDLVIERVGQILHERTRDL